MLPSWIGRLGLGGLCGAALLAVANLVQAQPPIPAAAPTELIAPEQGGASLLPPISAKTAPPSADSTDDLRARIEKLEQQNQELMKVLQSMSQSPVASGGKTGETISPPTVSQESVERIVGDYLKKRDAAKSKEDTAKKAEQERLGFTVGDNLGLSAKWNHGLWLESVDKSFKVHVGGRTQWDVVGVTAPFNVEYGTGGIGTYSDAVGFRRGRLVMEGTFWEVFDFNCEYDFFNAVNDDPTQPATPSNVINAPRPTDMWITMTHLPIVGNFRIGNHKPWIGFEHMTSSRFLNFLERSYQFDSFLEEGNNGFSPGMSFFNTIGEHDCGTWAVGVFKTTRSSLGWNVGDGEWGISSRATYLPLYKDNGRYLVHLGLGGTFKDLDDDVVRFRSRSMLRTGNNALHNISSIAQLRGENQTIINPEFVMNIGPVIIQSEYVAGWTTGVDRIIRTPTQTNVNVTKRTFFNQGFYLEALCFLTGEHREYNKKSGAFGRVIPYRNFHFVQAEDGGNIFSSGAWQVAARYSYLDNTNNDINGGTINSFTAGLNWFLNPNFKIQWNYEYGYRLIPNATSSGDYQGAGVRFAFDF